MKKIISSVLVATSFLCAYSLCADQVYDDIANGIKNRFGVDISQYQCANKAVAKSSQSVSTNVFTYQYTTDGYLQHVAVYSDSVICTNCEGPREGVQFIIMNNGAMMDMCNSYKQHTDYSVHKYSWGEVRTYKTYQIVTFK
jgi:hypothetical protein